MNRMQRLRPLAAALALAALLAACGGGGGGSDAGTDGTPPPAGPTAPADPSPDHPSPDHPAPGDPAPPQPAAAMQASSGAAGAALVQWQGLAGNGPWTLERQADGEAAAVALGAVADTAGARIDGGLAAGAGYRYRLRDAAGTAVAEAAVTTGTEAALVAEPGAALAAAQPRAVDAQAGEAAAGALALRFDAGTFAGAGTAQVTPHANPLADGVGDAWVVTLDRRPQRPLTVSLAYGADEDADAVDAQRLAVQQADGSWWLLAATTHDRTARRLTATLPPAMVPGATPAAAPAAGARATAAAADPHTVIRMTLVRFVAVKLRPREASVRVLGSLRLEPVATWVVRDDLCDPADPGFCVPGTSLVQRDLPIVNQKPGYDRRWVVEGSATPDASLGSVVPAAGAGAVYRAPATVPATNPVTLRFESVHAASGRRMAASARVRITEDAWVGPMTLSHAASGVGYYYDADTRWVLDPTRSTDSVRIYRAQGTVTLHIEAGPCGLTPSPASTALGPAAGFAELEVDEITERYRVQLNAVWATTLSTCRGTPMPTSAGVTFDQRGVLAGGRIQGAQQDGLSNRLWNLGRP